VIAKHTFKMTALCPHGGRDFYTAEVEVGRLVEVEKIVRIAAGYSDVPLYQEQLTERLASEIGGCKVTLTGLHGAVHTVTVAEDPCST
jgi:hypothetical protein